MTPSDYFHLAAFVVNCIALVFAIGSYREATRSLVRAKESLASARESLRRAEESAQRARQSLRMATHTENHSYG
jgi:hypothetical protein